MESIIPRCCGIDVHKAQLTACVRLSVGGEVVELVESFGTTTPDLLALRDYLKAQAVTHVAMESTGVYWKCLYYALEDEFELLLVNAAHIKHVPGRKTDTIDAAWIAHLLACGLLRASFVPPKPIRRLRDLTRYRKALVEERSRAVNRLHRILEDAGVKLSCVATDVMGVSGRAMMRALIEGQADPEALAEPARGRLRAKLPALRRALAGRFEEHHAFLLERMLTHVEDLESDIAALSGRIEEQIRPFEPAIALLRTIPGVERRAAEVLVAETGADMSRFPTAGHLAGWAGVCPGQNESAGKRKSAKTRRGSKWLRGTLTECTRAAGRSRDTYLSARYRQLARRRGDKKATLAIAHEILTTTWHMLTTGELYREPAPSRTCSTSRVQNP
ncbi:MAG: IS110 family RNA-guided transposase [Thermoleophilia bacterium]